MIGWRSCLAVVLVLVPLAAAHAAELGVLAPVLEQGKPRYLPGPTHQPAPVVTRLRDGALHGLLQAEAREGFTGRMLALDEQAQRLAADKPAAPTWLYLSLEDGGFARRGFWLQEAEGVRYVDEHFVDLVVDADSVADGSFEEIFAHELGHVFLRRLLPHLPSGNSRTPHHSFSLTDYQTAFDEGFATHFQLLVRRYTRNASLRAQDDGHDLRPLLPFWLSNRDRAARIDGVRRNLFVHAQQTPSPVAGVGVDPDRSTMFHPVRLRSGQQMLSSEGVVATLFHRWLAPGGDQDELSARYGEWFVALQALDREPLAADGPVLLALLRRYVALHPDTAANMTTIFVDTTLGATLDAAMPRQAEALAAAGAIGDIEAFVGGLKPARAALAALHERALNDSSTLDDALGPAIWLLSEGDAPRSVNLNLAEAEQLVALGLDGDAAARLLASRHRDGDFRDLADAVARGGLSATQADTLASRQAAMREAGLAHRL